MKNLNVNKIAEAPQVYVAPLIEVIEVAVEHGFAQSANNLPWNTDPDDGDPGN
jgi:hypothetical protein